MRELVEKYSRLGSLLMDVSAGIKSTARVCLSLNQHRQFIGFDIDEEVIEASIDLLILQFARQVVIPDPDIMVEYDIQEEARQYITA